MRNYRLMPTLCVAALFFIISSMVLVWILRAGVPESGEPAEEALLISFAIEYAESPPDEIDKPVLRKLLAELDDDAIRVADHFNIVSYRRNDDRYELILLAKNGRRFRLRDGSVQ